MSMPNTRCNLLSFPLWVVLLVVVTTTATTTSRSPARGGAAAARPRPAALQPKSAVWTSASLCGVQKITYKARQNNATPHMARKQQAAAEDEADAASKQELLIQLSHSVRI